MIVHALLGLLLVQYAPEFSEMVSAAGVRELLITRYDDTNAAGGLGGLGGGGGGYRHAAALFEPVAPDVVLPAGHCEQLVAPLAEL